MFNKAQFNKKGWHEAEAFLEAVKDQLPTESQRIYDARRFQPRDRTLAIRNKVVAGGTVSLFSGISSEQIDGINDFDGTKLENNVNFLLSRLTLNMALGTAATVTDKYDTLEYTTALQAALKSSTLIIEQNKDVIRRIPIASIHLAKSTDGQWLDLGGFALLKAGVTTDFKIEFSKNAAFALGGNDTAYVELLLDGYETATKN